jgi:hypothetical protein
VKVRIYDMNRNLVYELTEQKICPGSYSFTWDGTVNAGYYEYPPDEWSNIAPSGLYTFDVEVIANPYDRDAVRSQALTVVPGPVEYLGYDDGGRQMMRKMTITFTSCEFIHFVVIATQGMVRYGFMVLSWIWFRVG